MSNKLRIEKDIEITSSSPNDYRLKKRWGYIAALPSEYLIHFREGKLNEQTTGQGRSCFKNWNDTVFIIPTSLKEIIFEANQLTQDNVDVKIRGMALYHISDPMKIYKLLNFFNRQAAEEKLAQMIGDMCRSTSKWLVSNMQVAECIRKRKEDIAESLKKETSHVVADSQNGWGVEIVTIDIQDVYIQDAQIFNAMQMLFKSEKMRESKLAEMETERNLELKQLEQERELAEHRKNTELEKAKIAADLHEKKQDIEKNSEVKQLQIERELAEHRKNNALEKAKIEAELKGQRMEMEKLAEVSKLQTELELAEYRKNNELDKAQKDAEIKEQQIRLSKQNEEKQFELDKYRVEQNEKIAKYKLEQQIERESQQMQADFEKTQKKVEAQNLENQEKIRALRERIDAENATSPIMLEKHFSETALPSIAKAMAKSLKDVKINILRQDSETGVTPFHFIFSELMDVFKERTAPLQKVQSSSKDGEEV